MKKILLATTALLGFASVAAAEVTLSGSGRFGAVYADDGTTSDTFLSYRYRLNIDASTETESGITFGGRVRLQYDAGDTVDSSGEGAAELNAAMLYAEASGLRFEVGNVNTAMDSLGTLYNAELGFIGTTLGSYSTVAYDSYNSGPYASGEADRVGLFASYSVGTLVARISYVDYDQFTSADPEEISLAVDYAAGAYKLGFGYNLDSGGNDDYDVYALLGEYALNDTTNIGVQFIGENGGGSTDDQSLTLYGNTTLASGLGLSGFVSALDSDVDPVNDYAIGLGASYDLGGATLAGTIQQGYLDETYADLGVSFSF